MSRDHLVAQLIKAKHSAVVCSVQVLCLVRQWGLQKNKWDERKHKLLIS